MKPQIWILMAATAALGFVWWFGAPRDVGVVFCFTQRFWGLACPGCGMTRALHELLHLRIWSSLQFNPLALPFILYGAGLVFVAGRDVMKGTDEYRKWLYFKVSLPLAIGLALVLLAVWIRNVILY